MMFLAQIVKELGPSNLMNGFISAIPYVLQFNKRDLPTAVSTDAMYRNLNIKGEPTFEATATTGMGVFDTLKAVARLVLMDLKKK